MRRLRHAVDRHRPRLFSEVIGQEQAIRGLLRQLEAPGERASEFSDGRCILLHGADGCGKSTLARILGQALVCTGHLRPCGCCVNCQEFAEGKYLELEIIQPFHSDDEIITRLSRDRGWSELPRVVMVDQIILSDRVFDQCHEVLANPPSGVSYIFCVSRLEDIRIRTRALFDDFEVVKSSVQGRRELLSRLVRLEKWHLTPNQIELLSRNCILGYRALGRAVEHAIASGDDRLAVLMAGEQSVIETYLLSVLSANPFDSQLARLERLLEHPAIAIVAIEAALGSLFEASVYSGGELTEEPFGDHGRAIVSCMERRASQEGTSVERAFIRAMKIFCPIPAATRATLFRVAADFDQWANNFDPKFLQSDIAIDRRADPKRRLPPGKVKRTLIDAQISQFLPLEKAKKLWGCASFLVQAYGVRLNLRIVLRHEDLGTEDISELTTELQRELRSFCRRRDSVAYLLYVHEVHPQSGRQTLIVAHVAVDHAELCQWLLLRFLKKNRKLVVSARSVQFRSFQRYQNRAWRVHYHLASLVCRSLDEQGDARWAVDLLKLHKRSENVRLETSLPQTCGVSREIDDHAQMNASNDLSVRNFFDWTTSPAMTSNWELDDFAYRRKLVGDRRTRENRIREQFGTTAEAQVELDEFRAIYAREASQRERNRPCFIIQKN